MRAFLVDEALHLRLTTDLLSSKKRHDRMSKLPPGFTLATEDVYGEDPTGPVADPHGARRDA